MRSGRERMRCGRRQKALYKAQQDKQSSTVRGVGEVAKRTRSSSRTKINSLPPIIRPEPIKAIMRYKRMQKDRNTKSAPFFFSIISLPCCFAYEKMIRI